MPEGTSRLFRRTSGVLPEDCDVDTILAFATGAASTLAGASVGALALAIGIHLAKVAAEARSWHGIVSHAYPSTHPRFRTTYGAFAGAIGVNAVLPARVGEALRLGIVRRRVVGASTAAIAGTIVLETAIEAAFGLVVIGAVVLAGRSMGPADSPTAFVASHPIALAVVGFAAILLAGLACVMRQRVARTAASIAHGMSITRAPGPLLRRVLVWKLIAWLLRFAAVYAFLIAFHIPGGFWVVLLVIAAQNVAGLLPLAPGSAGTQQAALALALAGTVGVNSVVGFGVGMQLATGLSDVIVGIVAIALVSSWSDISDALRPSRRGLVSPRGAR